MDALFGQMSFLKGRRPIEESIKRAIPVSKNFRTKSIK